MKSWQWLLIFGAAILLFSGGVMGLLSIPDIVRVAVNAGFSGADLVTAVAVALAESRGNPQAKGDIDIPQAGSASYGLWQINSYWHPEYGPDFTTLYDPQTNANAAYAIYAAAGNRFTPWSTYKTGVYSSFVSAVESVLTA
jgi:hypothetical protein